jgi:hypothetical protein
MVLRFDEGRYAVTAYVKDGAGSVLHRRVTVEVVGARPVKRRAKERVG